jgi:hypothetical protein
MNNATGDPEMLTSQQITFFKTFGYLALPQALAADISWIQSEFEQSWKDRPDIIHDGSVRTTFPASFITTRPKLSTLIDHPVVCEVLDGLLGEGWSSYGGDGNFYAGETGWHSDVHPNTWTSKTVTPHVKVAFYLDHLTRDTGALRVIPGSHLYGDRYSTLLQDQVTQGENGPLGLHGRDIPAVALEIIPGDLVAFDHRLKHASFGGGNRRRMFTINNFAPCHTPEQSEAAREVMRIYRDSEKVNWAGRPGWLDWIDTLSDKGKFHHEPTVRLGQEVMNEMAVAST